MRHRGAGSEQIPEDGGYASAQASASEDRLVVEMCQWDGVSEVGGRSYSSPKAALL